MSDQQEVLRQAIQAIQDGDKQTGARLLTTILKQDPRNEQAWLWLSGAVETDTERSECLQRVLAINPNNEAAWRGLETLRAKSLEAILVGLTDPQKEAVQHQGSPLLIIAGPGSGKTEVIARRVAFLVRSGRVRSENILAVTFTEKAALGLKDRIQLKLPEINAELMQVSTIHSFCAELLRHYVAQSVTPRGFRILDDIGQFLLVYSNRKALGLSDIVKGRPKDFFDAVLRTFNLATEELVEPSGLESWCEQNCACCDEKESNLWNERKIVAEAYQRYCEMLQANSLTDFAFLQRYALDLIQNAPAILRELKGRYRAILVDEYQDTNAAQERLFLQLAGDGQNLTVVGDDDQGIYRFRGATVQNIQKFTERYPGAHIVKLVHNFRSRSPIVGHSQQVIVHNPARFAKDLQAVRGPGSDVLLIYERTVAEEASSISHLIKSLNQTGRIGSCSDVVILLRSVKSYAEAYSEALRAFGIPCLVIGNAALFQREEIDQLYSLINFLGASKEWGDKYIRLPLVGLSDVTCNLLKSYKGNLLEVTSQDGLKGIGITDPEDIKRLLQILTLKRKVQAQEQTSALEVFYALLSASGCLGRFELAGDETAITNLGIFSHLVAAWDEHGSTRNFYPFREFLELLKEGGVDPALPQVENAVQIMTIHQAKGLEFPVVVVGSAMDGRLPITHRRDPYEIPNHLRASGPPEVEDPHLIDERKLFYVAASRARDLLIIGTADVVNKRGGGPSPFVYEMFGDDLRAAAEFSEEKIKEIESRPPVGNRGPRPRYSFSQLAYYLQCPIRYKFAVVYNLALPWLDPVAFGSNVHRCLEVIHQRALQGQQVKQEDLPSLVETTWLSASRTKPEEEAAYRQAAIRQLSRYLLVYGDHLRQTTHAETFFSTSYNGQILLGKIDLIRQTDCNGLEIVDFKTSHSNPQEIEQSALQLSIYALGVEKELDRPISMLTAHFMADEQAVSWLWDAGRKADAQSRLADLFGRIERKEFPPQPSYCSRCLEFKDVCPYARGNP